MSSLYYLIAATRPNTYPIAISSILAAEALAYRTLSGFTAHQWGVAVLTVWTALSLQILSNLANDYGDGVKGVDKSRHAHSPMRVLQSGKVSRHMFKCWLVSWSVIAILSGLSLLVFALGLGVQFWAFIALGALSLWSAIVYSMGKRPYGHLALGELAVFIFFGLVAVQGGYYLQVGRLGGADVWLIAVGTGLLASCALYINNLRDVVSDGAAGKITLAIILGKYRVLAYCGLFIMAMGCYNLYAMRNFAGWTLVMSVIFATAHLYDVWSSRHSAALMSKNLKRIVGLMFVMNFFYTILL